MNKCIFKNIVTMLVLLVLLPFSSQASTSKTDKTILMIEVMGSANLVQKAKKLGYRVIILTANKDQRIVKPQTLKEADSYIIIDTQNENGVVKKAVELNKKHKIDAVIPGNEYFIVQSAMVAKKLGLRSISIEAAKNTRNKDQTLAALSNKKVPVPKSKVISSPEEIDTFKNYISFPAIIKPVDSAASDKVFKVHNTKEAKEKVKLITSPTDKFEMWGYPLRNKALFQEYIPGEEYSIEGIVTNGNTTVYSVTKKVSMYGFMEELDVVGKVSDPSLEKSIKSYVKKCTKALDVDNSPFHMEVRLTKQGNPLIMEIGTRIAGGCLTDLIDIAKNTNFAHDYFKILIDSNYKLKEPSTKQCAAIRVLYADKAIKLKNVEGFDKIHKKPWVVKSTQYRKSGDYLPQEPIFLRQLGSVIFTGKDMKEIKERNQIISNTIQFK